MLFEEEEEEDEAVLQAAMEAEVAARKKEEAAAREEKARVARQKREEEERGELIEYGEASAVAFDWSLVFDGQCREVSFEEARFLYRRSAVGEKHADPYTSTERRS